jgi:hypothetical protein
LDLIFSKHTEKKLNQEKWLGPLEKYENLPRGRLDHLDQFSCWSLYWIAIDFELKFINRSELEFELDSNGIWECLNSKLDQGA